MSLAYVIVYQFDPFLISQSLIDEIEDLVPVYYKWTQKAKKSFVKTFITDAPRYEEIDLIIPYNKKVALIMGTPKYISYVMLLGSLPQATVDFKRKTTTTNGPDETPVWPADVNAGHTSLYNLEFKDGRYNEFSDLGSEFNETYQYNLVIEDPSKSTYPFFAAIDYTDGDFVKRGVASLNSRVAGDAILDTWAQYPNLLLKFFDGIFLKDVAYYSTQTWYRFERFIMFNDFWGSDNTDQNGQFNYTLEVVDFNRNGFMERDAHHHVVSDKPVLVAKAEFFSEGIADWNQPPGERTMFNYVFSTEQTEENLEVIVNLPYWGDVVFDMEVFQSKLRLTNSQATSVGDYSLAALTFEIYVDEYTATALSGTKVKYDVTISTIWAEIPIQNRPASRDPVIINPDINNFQFIKDIRADEGDYSGLDGDLRQISILRKDGVRIWTQIHTPDSVTTTNGFNQSGIGYGPAPQPPPDNQGDSKINNFFWSQTNTNPPSEVLETWALSYDGPVLVENLPIIQQRQVRTRVVDYTYGVDATYSTVIRSTPLFQWNGLSLQTSIGMYSDETCVGLSCPPGYGFAVDTGFLLDSETNGPETPNNSADYWDSTSYLFDYSIFGDVCAVGTRWNYTNLNPTGTYEDFFFPGNVISPGADGGTLHALSLTGEYGASINQAADNYSDKRRRHYNILNHISNDDWIFSRDFTNFTAVGQEIYTKFGNGYYVGTGGRSGSEIQESIKEHRYLHTGATGYSTGTTERQLTITTSRAEVPIQNSIAYSNIRYIRIYLMNTKLEKLGIFEASMEIAGEYGFSDILLYNMLRQEKAVVNIGKKYTGTTDPLSEEDAETLANATVARLAVDAALTIHQNTYMSYSLLDWVMSRQDSYVDQYIMIDETKIAA